MKEQQSDVGKYSPEVEAILHKKPSLLVRKGILLLTAVVLLLLVGSHFIKYPERLAASVSFDTIPNDSSSSCQGQLFLTSAAASIVKSGQPVLMTLHADPESRLFNVTGSVSMIQQVGHGDYYKVIILPDTTAQLARFTGTAYIMIGETSLLSKILNPVFAVFRSADQ